MMCSLSPKSLWLRRDSGIPYDSHACMKEQSLSGPLVGGCMEQKCSSACFLLMFAHSDDMLQDRIGRLVRTSVAREMMLACSSEGTALMQCKV
mmetsp:Transcript_23784/g.70303  ORF Transcript_23784/g.70303 Transcript_23784/m.70303 type:complete len:93 (+) Transcript_23784:83-361(+)